MSSTIYLEGSATGENSKEMQTRCREAFSKLLNKSGFKGRMPRLVASGARSVAFKDFKNALATKQPSDFVGLWIDSEDPLRDLEAAREHLRVRPGDNWVRPTGAGDEDVLFMTTCMETLICADRSRLKKHYGDKLQLTALPPVSNLEDCGRREVLDQLAHATRNCTNAYEKGKRSFEVLGQLDPAVLQRHLPSFVRCLRILNKKLK